MPAAVGVLMLFLRLRMTFLVVASLWALARGTYLLAGNEPSGWPLLAAELLVLVGELRRQGIIG